MTLFTALRWPELLPSNFSPVYAIFFCAGVYLKGTRGWGLPLCLMFISDLTINIFYYPSNFGAVNSFMLISYPLYIGMILLGRRMSSRSPAILLVGGGLLGGIVFYLVTNVFSWLIYPAYPKTFAGLWQAFTLGQVGWYPQAFEFFRNTLASSALFTAIIVYAVRYARVSEKSEEEFQLKV
jgi:hypothetical protein